MPKKCLFILAVMLCLLVFPSGKPASADAGGACLGQWSECRTNCEKDMWIVGNAGLQNCYLNCDSQRNGCLAKSPTTKPGTE